MAISKLKHDIRYGELKDDTMLFEIALPMVNEEQSITSASLSTLNGQTTWTPTHWIAGLIKAVYVELEWESAGSGDIDLYSITDTAKLADLKAPTGASSKDIERVDVTSDVKGLSAATKLGIQAAGDGSNALTVYSAKLIVHLGVS